ncbi:MAG: murein biosynthesis integral membrane protein MurJ [Deltaproteobacteria bacterium]|nr:murein biosynthesis integral membrane protein MurJ [Deltaproteobacteria bacterium]
MSESEKKEINLAAGVVSFFTLLSRILGLVRDMVIASMFGSGMLTDAFFVAFRIPNLLRRLFAEGSLTISFIPVFTDYLYTKSKKDAFELARVILTVLSVILILVTLLGILLSPWIVRIQAFGFGGSGAKYDLTVLLTRITFPYIFFIGLVAFFMGVLNSLRHFAAPAAAPIFLNVSIIGAAYLISPQLKEPVVGLAIGVLIGGLFQLLLQIPWVIKEGFILLPSWNLNHPALKQIGRLMLPAVFGSAVYQINQFIGTLLASFLAEGSISWLYYADRLVQFPLGVFALSVSTAVLPSLSKEAAQNRLAEFGDTVIHSLQLIFFITLPAMAGLIVLGKPVIQILFQHGVFDSYDSVMTYKALLFYAVGLWAFAGIRVTVAGFYALKDTKTPVKIAIVAMIANLIFALCLMGKMRHAGLAFALSLASGIQLLLLLIFLNRKVNMGSIKPVIISVLKASLSALIMGITIYYLHLKWLTTGPGINIWVSVLDLSGLIVSGIMIYFITARLLNCPEIKAILSMLHLA